MWQSDFTHWHLEDGTDTEIISWLDDHSRKLLHCTAHTRITGTIVETTFITTMDQHGPPAATLTDNGMVYTTRYAGGSTRKQAQINGFEHLLADLQIDQRNGAPNHPTTQGKIERFHQTLKRWLTADGPAPDLEELNTQLERFTTIYNTQRPHRGINRRTPDQAYAALPKAFPTLELDQKHWRIRYDKVDTAGKITFRYAGKLRHLGIGRAHAGHRVILQAHSNNTITINPEHGDIIAEHTIDPTKNYQPRK